MEEVRQYTGEVAKEIHPEFGKRPPVEKVVNRPYTGILETMKPEEGDLKLIWNKNEADEVASVRAQFDKLRSKGYLAFKVEGKDGAKGEQITTFDPNAERIILAPPLKGG